ncbi:NFX1-type zinc finger-containing protein 1 [Mortierella antarctica]|nr:NFX1-type zinc finger-containing protein 1 [Mortierella antarctica]
MFVPLTLYLSPHVDSLNDNKNGAFDEMRRGILRQCSVVGMITTGAAKLQELIKKLAPKIIICQEVGEVLESHILSERLSSTQHLNLICDHKQLGSQIETYNCHRTLWQDVQP